MIAAVLIVTVGFSFGGCGGSGFLGLDDFQRDVVTGVVGALAGALLSNALPPVDNGAGLTIRTIPGPAGPAGPAGPTLFSVFADKFFGAQFVDGFEPVPVPDDGPALTRDAGPIGYRFLIPSIFADAGDEAQLNAQANTGLTPITMRLFLRRFGECNGNCFVFTIDGRRLRSGDSEPQCFGGSAEDCSDGTRWVLVGPVCGEGDDSAELFLSIDLPLGTGGLEFPEVESGDFLAFELNMFSDDGGTYRLLGVELFSSEQAVLSNASVLLSPDEIPSICEAAERPQPEIDCNGNETPDDLDIASGVSADCNGNGVPDECDIASGTSVDANGDGIPDECGEEEDGDDCNGNGVADEDDLADGTSEDCNENGVPDECDIESGASRDVNENGVPDECEPDCNGNGIPDELDIRNGTSEDCNENRIPDECDIADGTSQDANGNGIPDECEEDCNGNGVPDDLDILNGTSEDCNENRVPDECDIADGTSQDANENRIPDECEEGPDCNGNGVPDDLDILNGTSEDCNENRVPDECDIADGTSQDANENGIPDECEEDCNGNGVPDELDIRNGTSEDCNENRIPDECDIAEGRSRDVNHNGIPDECEEDCNENGVPDDLDIRNGTSQDCNENRIPDECDIADGRSRDDNNNGIPDECEEPENFCEDGRKPKSLTMVYTGDDCEATRHSQSEGRVTCEGDPRFAPRVRIVANDKPTPDHHRAITWFDGVVELGGEFVMDAENAQRSRLKGTTWVHIVSLDGEVLQSVSFHTSCSEPLVFGDQFGGVMLVDFEAEEGR